MLLESLLNIQSPVLEVALRFVVNLLIISILVRGIYFTYKRDEEFSFTFYLFNVLIFFVCYLMQEIEISLGFGFGLFAIFGVLRYRTITIPIKEMTYLFTAITIALINAIAPLNWMAVFMNLTIVIFVFVMEKTWFSKKELTTSIQYERIELLQESNEAVMEDIKQRTQLNVTRIQVKDYNFINDSATIKVYYLPYE